MSLLITLTPAEEAQIFTAARQTGLAPEVFAAKLVREHLPLDNIADELDKKLRERQQQDHVTLMPAQTAAELFAQWDKEAAQMTDEEREAEDRLWEDFLKGINQTRAELGMRQL